MATRALTDLQGRSYPSPSPAEGWLHPTVTAEMRRSRGFMRDGGTVYVSTRAGLNGAKAAVLGIALEAVLAAGIYGAWLLWRVVR